MENQQSAADSVLKRIFDWSKGRPLWQQDALRRIILSGQVTSDDLDELEALCRKEAGDSSVTTDATPIAEADLPVAGPGSQPISLRAIDTVQGANQLAAGQSLEFGRTGLTIIYGDNGAGKSGYARVLKKACRARCLTDILPDAFAVGIPAPNASASISYFEGQSVAQTALWRDGKAPDPLLTRISVFDRECGNVHLKDKNEVAFRPFGLDIPDTLAVVLIEVKDRLTSRKARLIKSPMFEKPAWNPATNAGKALSSLNAKTRIADLDAWAKCPPEIASRLEQLNSDLAKDPTKAAAEQILVADTLKQLAAQLRTIGSQIGADDISDLAATGDDARGKRAAATLAASAAFQDAKLIGVGSESWRELWNAAKHYALHEAKLQAFPPVGSNEVCVLCQQQLSDEGVAQLDKFDEFVKAEVEKTALAAERSFRDALAKLKSYRIKTQQFSLVRKQVAIHNPDVSRRLSRFVASARLRLHLAIKQAVVGGGVAIPSLPANPASEIDALEQTVRDYAAQLLQAVDATGRAALELERDELRDHILLTSNIDAAKAEVARIVDDARLDKCLSGISTTAITKLGNDLADGFITPTIRDRFQREIVRLAADRVRVEIVRAGGKFGSPQYQVKFFANANAKVHMVLSEGEQTCVALAAFLTELSTATHKSGIIFDDPVSSLDHRWRKSVAKRLVEVASERQVIVFTHDLVFVNDLKDYCSEFTVPLELQTVSRGGAGTGTVLAGLPWEAKSIADRVDKLEKELRQAKAAYDAGNEDDYRSQLYGIYSRLRATWERAIEDTAFATVVIRHRDYINTKNLRRVTALTPNDCDLFDAGFKKCCDQVDAHDPSRGRGISFPGPDEVMRDIHAVRDWVVDLRQRQNQVPTP